MSARDDPASLIQVQCTWNEKVAEQWIRFGRIASERIIDRKTSIKFFRPHAIFAFVDWKAREHGTIYSSIAIIRAVAPDEAYTTFENVRPGGEILLHIETWPKVAQVLEAIDAVEAVGIYAADASPDHWRHVGNRLSAGMSFRPYTQERHQAWLRRMAVEG